MDVPESLRLRLRVGIGALIVLLLVGLGCAVLFSALARTGEGSELSRAEPETTTEMSVSGSVILIHVLGSVAVPGLYELREGDRVVDAVAAAGGFADEADQAGVNLARPVSDGEQLIVPQRGEGPAVALVDDRVNLNTADLAALETLPQVGPALAARILAWREANGGFASVDDLLNVSGIGNKTFEDLRDLVTT